MAIMTNDLMLLRCEPEVTITEGAPRGVSEVHERYITQRGSVGTRMGLGFNMCCAYSDVLSLYFKGRDRLGFGGGGRKQGIGM